MTVTTANKTLIEAFGPTEGAALLIKRIVLVALGIVALTVAAKVKVPLWGSPVPLTLGTFAVFSIGAAYGPRLGLTTIFGYMLIGALGFDVFAGSTAGTTGLEYMTGSTGGYLVGFVLATVALGYAAQRGWDRSVLSMAIAMLVGNALIYIPGVLWLAQLYTWEQPILAWGLTPFLIGDAVKLVLAAMLFPALWKLVGKARG